MVLNPNSDGAPESGLKPLRIPRGTLVHVQGLPFLTTADAPVEGHPANLEMALREKWSDAARAAAAAGRKARRKGRDWRTGARVTYQLMTTRGARAQGSPRQRQRFAGPRKAETTRWPE